MNCAAMKGFLTLGDCGNPALRTCSHCARPMCTAHLSPAAGFSMCYDCAATQQEPGQEQRPEQRADQDYDDTWAHGYRASYYSSSGYRPGTYDSQDARSFDQRRAVGFDEDNEPGGFDAS